MCQRAYRGVSTCPSRAGVKVPWCGKGCLEVSGSDQS